MKRLIISILCLTLLSMPMLPAQASIGRDILMVYRQINNWTRDDQVWILEADGSRHLFDLKGIEYAKISSPEDLLFFLRTHGLSESTMLYDAPAPVALKPASAELVQQVRKLLAQMEEDAYRTKLVALDAGARLTYAVIMKDGEAALSLISEGGTHVGQSNDPAALELMRLVGPHLMGE